MNKELKMDLNAHNEYLTRKLAHYNEWLLDKNREFGKPYPGFPEDLKRKGKKMQSNVIADMTEVLSGKKAAPASAKAKPKARAAKKSDGPRAGSKGEAAVAIYKRLGGDKSAVISAIQAELGMSLAGSTTYFYNAKKASA
jgi:hypothetical protein